MKAKGTAVCALIAGSQVDVRDDSMSLWIQHHYLSCLRKSLPQSQRAGDSFQLSSQADVLHTTGDKKADHEKSQWNQKTKSRMQSCIRCQAEYGR